MPRKGTTEAQRHKGNEGRCVCLSEYLFFEQEEAEVTEEVFLLALFPPVQKREVKGEGRTPRKGIFTRRRGDAEKYQSKEQSIAQRRIRVFEEGRGAKHFLRASAPPRENSFSFELIAGLFVTLRVGAESDSFEQEEREVTEEVSRLTLFPPVQERETKARYERRAAPLPSPPHEWEGAGREGGSLVAIQGEPR